MQVNIKIANASEIRRAFNKAPRLMDKELNTAMWRMGALVQRESMQRTPVLTGRLRASHTLNVSGGGIGKTATIQPTANYAIFVHDGTRFIQARPFLKEGADDSMNDIQDGFVRAVQNVFDEIGRSV